MSPFVSLVRSLLGVISTRTISSGCGIAGSARLGDGVVVAAQAGVAGHVTVGDGAILSARTGVTASIEGGKTYSGMPARPLMEEQRFKAQIRRLPKLIERVKSLEEARDKKPEDRG